MFYFEYVFHFHFLQLKIVPVLHGKCVLYSFESPPEVRIGVTFGVFEIPGIASLLVCFGFLHKHVESGRYL